MLRILILFPCLCAFAIAQEKEQKPFAFDPRIAFGLGGVTAKERDAYLKATDGKRVILEGEFKYANRETIMLLPGERTAVISFADPTVEQKIAKATGGEMTKQKTIRMKLLAFADFKTTEKRIAEDYVPPPELKVDQRGGVSGSFSGSGGRAPKSRLSNEDAEKLRKQFKDAEAKGKVETVVVKVWADKFKDATSFAAP